MWCYPIFPGNKSIHCVLIPCFSLSFLCSLFWKKKSFTFGSRISLLSPNITSFMFSQVTTLPPSGFYYLGHLQHTVRALCLISVALMTHLVSQMPPWYKDSLRHPIFHDCMTYTNDWILLWCSHAFGTVVNHIWILRKKSRCSDFLVGISHSLQCFPVMLKAETCDCSVSNWAYVGRVFSPKQWPSGQWNAFVYVFLGAHWAPLFTEDAPKSQSLIEQSFLCLL